MDKLNQLERGIQLKDDRTLPCKARLIPTPSSHRVDRDQASRGQESTDPTYDRRWRLVYAADRTRGNWADPIGGSGCGEMARINAS